MNFSKGVATSTLDLTLVFVFRVRRSCLGLFFRSNLSFRLDPHVSLVLGVPFDVRKVVGIAHDRCSLEVVERRRARAIPLERRTTPRVSGGSLAFEQRMQEHDQSE